MSLAYALAEVHDGVWWFVKCSKDGLMLWSVLTPLPETLLRSVACTQETMWKSMVHSVFRNHVGVYMIHAPTHSKGKVATFAVALMTPESQLKKRDIEGFRENPNSPRTCLTLSFFLNANITAYTEIIK